MGNHQFTTPTVVYIGPAYTGQQPAPAIKVAATSAKSGR